MFPEIIQYSCFINFEPLNNERLQVARRLVEKFELPIDLTQTYMEFDYSGRDTNRKIVKLLIELAPVIGNAQGEVKCELAWENSDSSFEFYLIKDGCLLRQIGHLVRNPAEVISDSKAMESEYLAVN